MTTLPALLANIAATLRYTAAQARKERRRQAVNAPPSTSSVGPHADRQGRGVDRETAEAGERALADVVAAESEDRP
jgi:hypothetical protein